MDKYYIRFGEIDMGRTKTIREEAVCPRCKGRGVVYDRALGVFTFDIGAVLQSLDRGLRDTCPRCGGSGYVFRTTTITEY